MKTLKFIASFFIIVSVSICILLIVVKKSIPEDTINTILQYVQTKHEMPEELENFKNTEEYQKIEQELININTLLNDSKTKIVIKYLEIVNSPTIISILIISTLIILITGICIYQNAFPVLINSSISSFLTGGFMLIAPSILGTPRTNEIITNLFNNFTNYGIYIIIISLIILFISITMSKIKK